MNEEQKPDSITVGRLLENLKQFLEGLYDLQMNGKIFIPESVSYPLSRNYAKVVAVGNAFKHYQTSQLKEHVVIKDDKFQTTEKNDDWVYKSDSDKAVYMEKMTKYSEKAVDWQPYKIYIEELKLVRNLPINSIAVLEEFGIITDVQIVVPTLKVKR